MAAQKPSDSIWQGETSLLVVVPNRDKRNFRGCNSVSIFVMSSSTVKVQLLWRMTTQASSTKFASEFDSARPPRGCQRALSRSVENEDPHHEKRTGHLAPDDSSHVQISPACLEEARYCLLMSCLTVDLELQPRSKKVARSSVPMSCWSGEVMSKPASASMLEKHDRQSSVPRNSYFSEWTRNFPTRQKRLKLRVAKLSSVLTAYTAMSSEFYKLVIRHVRFDIARVIVGLKP